MAIGVAVNSIYRYVSLCIQNTGRLISISRIVPPPNAVANATISTPKKSIRFCIAVREPDTANDHTPERSSMVRSRLVSTVFCVIYGYIVFFDATNVMFLPYISLYDRVYLWEKIISLSLNK